MKNVAGLSGHQPATAPVAGQPASATDLSTRDRVTRLLLERGATTAAQLGDALGLSPAAIRRHLDAMLADGDVVAREQAVRGSRGRGRPAKVFELTDAARGRCGTHHYDNMATAALRWIARNGGSAAVEAFAADQVDALEARCRAAMEDASGGQLCQHHCPVAHVAAEFPQLCEAETAVISRLVGTHVQRLATIAHGDGVCTTHIPAQPRAQSGNTVTTVRTDR